MCVLILSDRAVILQLSQSNQTIRNLRTLMLAPTTGCHLPTFLPLVAELHFLTAPSHEVRLLLLFCSSDDCPLSHLPRYATSVIIHSDPLASWSRAFLNCSQRKYFWLRLLPKVMLRQRAYSSEHDFRLKFLLFFSLRNPTLGSIRASALHAAAWPISLGLKDSPFVPSLPLPSACVAAAADTSLQPPLPVMLGACTPDFLEWTRRTGSSLVLDLPFHTRSIAPVLFAGRPDLHKFDFAPRRECMIPSMSCCWASFEFRLFRLCKRWCSRSSSVTSRTLSS